ncbi:hypothetical protein HGRIS_002090 [Hohenbuehelia grisea]|uniref:Cytochrome P450 n=1 Tax=Hohenbuehelia grisea TaxID=104357 RepID=A0ABR3JJF4_9AGAR
MIPAVAGAAALLLLSGIVLRSLKTRSPPGIPQIGHPGVVGYVFAALRFTVHSDEVIAEGASTFKGGPFAVPTLAGWFIVLGKNHLDTLRTSNDATFNQPIAVNEALRLDYTMNLEQLRNPYQSIVARNDITRGISAFIPEVLDETVLTMEDTFRSTDGSGFISVPLFHTMTMMVGRISNRAMLGTELCRNRHFIHAVVGFAETLVLYAQLLNWTPTMLRPIVYFVLTLLFGGPKQPTKYILPYVEKRLRERETSPDDGPYNITEFLINAAPATDSTADIVMRILNLNFGSIHTTSIFGSQAIFEMAVMRKEDLNSIREEVIQALDEEGGWNKASLARFRKLDSILREVGRVYGLALMAMNRLALHDTVLVDGTVIPAGWTVSLNLRDIHLDPDIYPNPEVFDPFRFSKLRHEEESSVKHGFTTIDPHYIPFGAGRHACPGRFFAAMELKIMLAHLLLNYDFRLVDSERPQNVVFHGSALPNQKAHVIFSPRSTPGKVA